jgi:RNA polymerase-binding transcription factor DksA
VDIPSGPVDSLDPLDPVTLDQLDEPDLPDEPDLDLDAVERDLHGVEVALDRLDEGTYWTDEIDGRPIPDELLERDPIARRAG